MLLNFPLLKLWGPESKHNVIYIYNVPLEPERAAKARRAVVASVSKYHFTMAEDGGSGTGDNIIRIMPKVVD